MTWRRRSLVELFEEYPCEMKAGERSKRASVLLARWQGCCANSLNHVTIEQLLCGRSVDVVFDDAKLRAGADNFKEDLVVFGVVPPTPGFASPYDSIAIYPASISPDVIVDWAYIGQEQHAVGS